MIKKSIINDFQLSFNPEYEIIGDFDLVLKLAMVTHLGGINEYLTYYRLHQDNLTYKKTKLNSHELLNLLKKLENDPEIFNSPNFIVFKDNVIFYKCIVSILEGHRLFALRSNLGKMNYLYNKIKLILTLCLPNNLILYLRNR